MWDYVGCLSDSFGGIQGSRGWGDHIKSPTLKNSRQKSKKQFFLLTRAIKFKKIAINDLFIEK